MGSQIAVVLETPIMFMCIVDDALFVALARKYYCLMCRVTEKVVDSYSGTLVGVATSGMMETVLLQETVVAEQRSLCMYYGGMLDDDGDEK